MAKASSWEDNKTVEANSKGRCKFGSFAFNHKKDIIVIVSPLVKTYLCSYQLHYLVYS
jgi:hypothetical protein